MTTKPLGAWVGAPFRGQGSERDFRRFKADPLFLFEDALPDPYRAPR